MRPDRQPSDQERLQQPSNNRLECSEAPEQPNHDGPCPIFKVVGLLIFELQRQKEKRERFCAF